MFGVCCTNPIKPTDPSTSTTTLEPTIEPEDPLDPEPESNNTYAESAKLPLYPEISQWPPPLPTHPPDHTIPPLPTHPPSPGYPTLAPPSAWPPTTKKPTKKPPTVLYPGYPTKPPTVQYPGYPTQPPYKPPTTTKAPIDMPQIPIGSCGAKNGFQDQGKIVGGHNAEVNEWPWIAALFNAGRQFCGGSLIDDIHILSAAHCVAQ